MARTRARDYISKWQQDFSISRSSAQQFLLQQRYSSFALYLPRRSTPHNGSSAALKRRNKGSGVEPRRDVAETCDQVCFELAAVPSIDPFAYGCIFFRQKRMEGDRCLKQRRLSFFLAQRWLPKRQRRRQSGASPLSSAGLVAGHRPARHAVGPIHAAGPVIVVGIAARGAAPRGWSGEVPCRHVSILFATVPLVAPIFMPFADRPGRTFCRVSTVAPITTLFFSLPLCCYLQSHGLGFRCTFDGASALSWRPFRDCSGRGFWRRLFDNGGKWRLGMANMPLRNQISHPHIVQLIEVFREAHMCYLVMELVRGGELFDRIVARTCYDEVTARGIVRLLLMTVHYLHSHNVVHRDIKPENLLLMRHNDDCQVKIADFGFAEHISVLEECSAVCGTPQYVAPEILQGQRYGATVDVWSMGVVTFVLLGGYPPFYDREKKQLFRKIVRGQYEFHSPFWDHVSQEAKDFIRCMLVVDARSRRTAAQLLEHRWIRGPSAARLLPGPGGERHFRNYDARRRLRAAGFAVIAAHRLQTRAKRARAGGGGGSPATPQWRATAESRLDSDEDLENSVVAVAVPLQMG
ncbi:unnamed protein product, partial [Phaeothamnion confervicola]